MSSIEALSRGSPPNTEMTVRDDQSVLPGKGIVADFCPTNLLGAFMVELNAVQPSVSLDPAEERRLGARARDGDPDATRRIVEFHLPLAVNLASEVARTRFSRRSASAFWNNLLELVAWGNLGLVKGIASYDEGKGDFTTHAQHWILKGIYDGLDLQEEVRIPPEKRKEIRLIRRLILELEKSLGRTPQTAEIAKALIEEKGVQRLEKVIEGLHDCLHRPPTAAEIIDGVAYERAICKLAKKEHKRDHLNITKIMKVVTFETSTFFVPSIHEKNDPHIPDITERLNNEFDLRLTPESVASAIMEERPEEAVYEEARQRNEYFLTEQTDESSTKYARIIYRMLPVCLRKIPYGILTRYMNTILEAVSTTSNLMRTYSLEMPRFPSDGKDGPDLDTIGDTVTNNSLLVHRITFEQQIILRILLTQAWRLLTLEQREIITLLAQGYTAVEIAEIRSVRKQAVYKQLAQARTTIAKQPELHRCLIEYLDFDTRGDGNRRKYRKK